MGAARWPRAAVRYLERLSETYEANSSLRSVALLIRRAQRDFETALEATLSGYQGVAADAMRDVMEIEALFLDFGVNEGHADEWLGCNRTTRLRKYLPAKVRRRLNAAGVPPVCRGFIRADRLQGAQRVAPRDADHAARGESRHRVAASSLFADAGFNEMFVHAARLLNAAEFLRGSRTGTEASDWQALGPLDAFHDAKDRTIEMLVRTIAFAEGPGILEHQLGRAPTTAEILSYVADEIRTKARVPKVTMSSR